MSMSFFPSGTSETGTCIIAFPTFFCENVIDSTSFNFNFYTWYTILERCTKKLINKTSTMLLQLHYFIPNLRSVVLFFGEPDVRLFHSWTSHPHFRVCPNKEGIMKPFFHLIFPRSYSKITCI